MLSTFGRMPLDRLGPKDVATWFHAASRDKTGAANRALEILRAMMFGAEEWKLRERGTNPCLGIATKSRADSAMTAPLTCAAAVLANSQIAAAATKPGGDRIAVSRQPTSAHASETPIPEEMAGVRSRGSRWPQPSYATHGRHHRCRCDRDGDLPAWNGTDWKAVMVVRSEITAEGVRAVTAPCPVRKTGARTTPPAMHFPPS